MGIYGFYKMYEHTELVSSPLISHNRKLADVTIDLEVSSMKWGSQSGMLRIHGFAMGLVSINFYFVGRALGRGKTGGI